MKLFTQEVDGVIFDVFDDGFTAKRYVQKTVLRNSERSIYNPSGQITVTDTEDVDCDLPEELYDRGEEILAERKARDAERTKRNLFPEADGWGNLIEEMHPD